MVGGLERGSGWQFRTFMQLIATVLWQECASRSPHPRLSVSQPFEAILNRCCCRSNHFWAVNLKIVLTFRQFADHPHANPPTNHYISSRSFSGAFVRRKLAARQRVSAMQFATSIWFDLIRVELSCVSDFPTFRVCIGFALAVCLIWHLGLLCNWPYKLVGRTYP